MYTKKLFFLRRLLGRIFDIFRDRNYIIERMSKYRRVLDVGCGDFKFLLEVKRRGLADELYGIDIADLQPPDGIVYIKHNAEEPFPFDDEYFDAVFCFHLLEHLENPERCIKEISRVLKKGGRLYLILPKERFRGEHVVLCSIFMSLLNMRIITPWDIHKRKFTENDIKEILEGFEIEEFKILSQTPIGWPKSYVVIARKP